MLVFYILVWFEISDTIDFFQRGGHYFYTKNIYISYISIELLFLCFLFFFLLKYFYDVLNKRYYLTDNQVWKYAQYY